MTWWTLSYSYGTTGSILKRWGPADGSNHLFDVGVVGCFFHCGPQSEAEGETMNEATLIIQFSSVTWEPTAIFPNGETDTKTEKLNEFATRMLASITGPKSEDDES